MRATSHACAANRSACPDTMRADTHQGSGGDATSSCNRAGRTAISASRMAPDAIQVGDRVINLQVPGIFTVIDRQGSRLVIQTDRGLRMVVLESAVRRVANGESPPES